MKIYAKQVPPENQESPLFMGEWPENVYCFGNRHFIGNGEKEVENLQNAMCDACDELKRLEHGEFCPGEYSFIEILNDFLAPEHKNEYTRAERLQWRDLLLSYDDGSIDDDDATTAALELITGKEYNSATIRGCCQGDWQNVIYPAEYGREWLEHFEIEYFNTGTEWRINEGEPGSDDEYYFYTHEWSDEGTRREIAEAVGADANDVVLYAFDGWSRTPKYREVV